MFQKSQQKWDQPQRIAPWRRGRWLLFLLPLLWLLATPQPANAHPLGNFSVNRYSRIELMPAQLRLVYVVDMAEIPTFQIWSQVDLNGDKQVTEMEKEQFVKQTMPALLSNLDLQINAQNITLQPQSQELTFPPGQGDLPTLRLHLTFQAELPTNNSSWQLTYEDHNYTDRLGWQEIVYASDKNIYVSSATIDTVDISAELTNYPVDLLQNPPAIRSAQIEFRAGTTTNTSPITASNQPTVANRTDRFSSDQFANLISITNLTPSTIFLTLLIAFGLGGLHALSPGHGKTIVGAYLIGSRGTAKHALFLGLTTTITHTAGVFLLGFIVLVASEFILPEQLYPWLGLLSGLLVVLIGFSLFRNQWRNIHKTDTHASETGYHYHLGVGHSHLPPKNENQPVSWKSLLGLGISGGLLPCPSALVVMLSAIALHRIFFGLVLISVFSLGLATVLTGIGMVLVYAGRFLERSPIRFGKVAQLMPMFSALIVTLLGVGITWQAFVQMGIL